MKLIDQNPADFVTREVARLTEHDTSLDEQLALHLIVTSCAQVIADDVANGDRAWAPTVARYVEARDRYRAMVARRAQRDLLLSRSRTSDAEKQAAGVMTDAEQRAHNKLVKDVFNAAAGKVERTGPGDAAVDDRWTTDAPSWLVGVDPPEDQPGTIAEQQRKQIMAIYTAMKISTHDSRLVDIKKVLGVEVASTNELSFQQAARLLENLHERHTGKMTRR